MNFGEQYPITTVPGRVTSRLLGCLFRVSRRRKKMRTNYLLLIALLSPFVCSASSAAGLCTETEFVVWSCAIGKKAYAACASNDLSASTGYIQYRASDNGKVTFRFPE